MSPAFQGIFLTTGPPGKPLYSLLYICKMVFAEHKPLIDGMWLTAEKVKTTNQPFVLESIMWVQDCELLETKNTCELNHNKRIHSLVLLEQRKEWDCPVEGACGKLKVWKWKSLSPVNSFQPHGLYSPWNSLGQNTVWVPFPFFRGSSQLRDQTQVSHIAGGFFTSWATGKLKGSWIMGKAFSIFSSRWMKAISWLFLVMINCLELCSIQAFPGGTVGKGPACQWRKMQEMGVQSRGQEDPLE